MTNDLWKIGAAQLSKRLDDGTISARDVADAFIARIERLNPLVNAFVAFDAVAVRAQADEATARQRAGKRLSAIDGLPVAIKDNIFVAGMPAQWGSLLYCDFMPDHDDICIERLRASGAVVLGKTTTPEFSASGRTESLLTGSTRLPWDLRLTAGGSSGGSAAALSAGLTPLALGTDAGGSTRMPAAYHGLVGLRPSNGRIPRVPGFPPMSHDFQTIGVLARTTEDARLLYDAISGPDSRDPVSCRFATKGRPETRSRIGWFAAVGGMTADDEVLDSFENALSALSATGYDPRQDKAPFAPEALAPVWDVFTAASAARIAKRFPDRWEAEMSPAIAALARRGSALSAGDYADAFDTLTAFRSQTMAAWPDVDVIATPTVPSPAWPAEEVHPRTIGGNEGSVDIQGMYCGWVNALGLPAISVPIHPHPDGRPIGMQLIARHGEEARLWDLAQSVETLAPWAQRRPEIAGD